MQKVTRWAAYAMLLGATAVAAQNYPSRPIRIVTTDVGNNNDFFARIIGQGLSERMGQQVVVENRGGAGGGIAADRVIKALPDGYTLMVHGTSIWLLPLLKETPWDPFRDFTPISTISRNSAVVVVNTSVPAKSIKELIAVAKAKPGSLNYSSTDDGSPSHLAAELLNSLAGINIVRISYKGGAQAFTSLVGNESQVMVSAIQPAMPHVKAGRLTALAVTAPTRVLPNLPPVSATVPGYEWITRQAIFAPPKTPAALVKRLNQEVVAVLTNPETVAKLFTSGAEAATSTPEELTAMMKSQMAIMGKVIKAANIRHN